MIGINLVHYVDQFRIRHGTSTCPTYNRVYRRQGCAYFYHWSGRVLNIAGADRRSVMETRLSIIS